MSSMRRIALASVAGTVLFALAAPVAMSGSGSRTAPAPVTTFVDPTFGRVLARRDRQVLYYWQEEKKAGGKLRCFGECARAWPPLIVKSRAAVPRKVPGIRGRFGVVKRPNGALQVTYNGLAVYTYAHERPRQVLCNDVDGWFVVRV